MHQLDKAKKSPYISQIHVLNCYAFNNFSIPRARTSVLKHLILTGLNGSGKTTILNSVAFILSLHQRGVDLTNQINQYQSLIAANPNGKATNEWKHQIKLLTDIKIEFTSTDLNLIKSKEFIVAHFKAHRIFSLPDVSTVTKEDDLTKTFKNTPTEQIAATFKQYLVNRKVYEAFAYIEGRGDDLLKSKRFFETINQALRVIFNDDKIELIFNQPEFEFYIKLGSGREITFNQFPAGFSAFSNIVMTLLMQVDAVQKNSKDVFFEPAGIVVIDEPETHFHLSMQYQILPLINKLFPNFQLIIATHSPAVISSLKEAVVFDISSQSEVSDWLLGSSYSELMIKHFGLDNEFSNVADKIIDEVKEAVKTKNSGRLKNIIIENGKYLTPSLRLEIESQIAYLNSYSDND